MIQEVLAAASPPREAEQETRGGALERDDFLQMLIAQLEHQDPLNPQDATEFSSQLAQFSSLEQLIAIGDGMGALAEAQAGLTESIQGLAATGLLDREARVHDMRFEVGRDGELLSSPVFELASATSSTALTVFGPDGGLRGAIDLGGLPAGLFRPTAEQLAELQLSPGIHEYAVDASSGEQAVEAELFTAGRVSGAVPAGGETLLQIGSLALPYRQLAAIGSGGGGE